MTREELDSILKAVIEEQTGGITTKMRLLSSRDIELEFGRRVYNRALDDAAENAHCCWMEETNFNGSIQIKRTGYAGPANKIWEGNSEYWPEVDKESILKL